MLSAQRKKNIIIKRKHGNTLPQKKLKSQEIEKQVKQLMEKMLKCLLKVP